MAAGSHEAQQFSCAAPACAAAFLHVIALTTSCSQHEHVIACMLEENQQVV
jgi:hypothetical protein